MWGNQSYHVNSESLLDSLLAFTEAEVEVAEMLAEVPKLIRKAERWGKTLGWFVKSWVFLVGKKGSCFRKARIQS